MRVDAKAVRIIMDAIKFTESHPNTKASKPTAIRLGGFTTVFVTIRGEHGEIGTICSNMKFSSFDEAATDFFRSAGYFLVD